MRVILLIVHGIPKSRDMTMTKFKPLLTNELEPYARHFFRCELILALIDTLEKPTLEDIAGEAGLPKRTVHAIFKRLEEQHRVLIERVNGRRHGYYEIVDWGNLDRQKIIAHINRHLRSMDRELETQMQIEYSLAEIDNF